MAKSFDVQESIGYLLPGTNLGIKGASKFCLYFYLEREKRMNGQWLHFLFYQTRVNNVITIYSFRIGAQVSNASYRCLGFELREGALKSEVSKILQIARFIGSWHCTHSDIMLNIQFDMSIFEQYVSKYSITDSDMTSYTDCPFPQQGLVLAREASYSCS